MHESDELVGSTSNESTARKAPELTKPPALSRDQVERALDEWSREAKQMNKTLAGVFELSGELAATQLQ